MIANEPNALGRTRNAYNSPNIIANNPDALVRSNNEEEREQLAEQHCKRTERARENEEERQQLTRGAT